jgi:hypothetical protein
MTGLTSSPNTSHGAIVGLNPDRAGRSVLVPFQYNADEVTRSLQARSPDLGGGTAPAGRNQALRLTGPPIETIDLAVELDATDKLAEADPVATRFGVYPQLAALEMLLYPTSDRVSEDARLAANGSIELVPLEAPLSVLVWGPGRVVPVRITQLTIVEQAFDPRLSPIRAQVRLGLRVLTYSDLPDGAGSALFLAHQIAMEGLAALGTGVSAAAAVVRGAESLGV